MMTTLLRHQFRSTWRTLGSVVGAMALVVAVSLAAALLRLPVLGPFGQGVATAVLIGLVPVVLVVLALDYWQSMYGREGYFTMSLPVRGRELLAAKTLHAALIALASVLLACGGAVATLVAGARLDRVPVGEALSGWWDRLGALPGATVWLVVVGAVLYLGALVVQVASVLSISAEGRFNHLGAGAPLIGLVVLYLVNQVVSLVAMLWIPVGVLLQGPDAGQVVARGMWGGFVEAVRTGADPDVIGLGSLVSGVVVAALLAWWAVRSVEHHTSLR